jgi:Flp pilus assembly protein CpaB
MPRFHRPRSLVHTARRAAAVLFAAVAVVLALRPVPVPAPVTAPGVVAVTVSARDLPGGTVLVAGDLEVARFPTDVTPAGTTADPGQLVHRVLAGGVRTGEPLTEARLVGPGLAALLPAGQVAAPVRLADLAVAALVRTGDRVDVLATPPEAATAEVVAAGVLVLAATGIGTDEESGGGLLLIAVDGPTAARLAAAATTATLTVNLPSP